MTPGNQNGTNVALTALLVSPNRELAERFHSAAVEGQCFQILADLKSYLSDQVTELRLRQFNPAVILIDLTTDVEAACQMIRFLSSRTAVVPVIGLHSQQDSDALVKSLRAGASEYLWFPFDCHAQREAATRIAKLRRSEDAASPGAGAIIGFASTKPGSGSSTLATQTAFALQKLSAKKVLLADLDLLGGTIGFYLKLHRAFSLLDAMNGADAAGWQTQLANQGGVDILPSPEEPCAVEIDPGRLQETLQVARQYYDYIILDLPTIFKKASLLGFSETDSAFLVTTPELPSLHLTRKALQMLDQLGFEKSKYSVVVNRHSRQQGLGDGDLAKMFGTRIRASLPNDYFSLHRAVTRGEPIEGDGELGKAVAELAAGMAGSAPSGPRQSRILFGAKPVFSQI
jgi:pilus assembly protein CpaE